MPATEVLAMPNIRCPACGSSLQRRKRYVNCPWCGQPLAAVYKAQPFEAGDAYRSWPTWKGWAGAAALTVPAACLVFIGDRLMEPIAGLSADEQVARALAACQARIAALSVGAKVPAPPPAKNYGTLPEFYFVWPRGVFYYADSEGVLNAASATCRGYVATGLITELSLNGQDVTTAPRRENW